MRAQPASAGRDARMHPATCRHRQGCTGSHAPVATTHPGSLAYVAATGAAGNPRTRPHIPAAPAAAPWAAFPAAASHSQALPPPCRQRLHSHPQGLPSPLPRTLPPLPPLMPLARAPCCPAHAPPSNAPARIPAPTGSGSTPEAHRPRPSSGMAVSCACFCCGCTCGCTSALNRWKEWRTAYVPCFSFLSLGARAWPGPWEACSLPPLAAKIIAILALATCALVSHRSGAGLPA